jgi:hypothetical protein
MILDPARQNHRPPVLGGPDCDSSAYPTLGKREIASAWTQGFPLDGHCGAVLNHPGFGKSRGKPERCELLRGISDIEQAGALLSSFQQDPSGRGGKVFNAPRLLVKPQIHFIQSYLVKNSFGSASRCKEQTDAKQFDQEVEALA